MVSLSHSPINDTRLKDFLSDVREIGRVSGAGKDALPLLAMKVVQAAADGVIGTDDAKEIYEQYVEAESKKRQHTEGGATANASKLRQIIKFGARATAGEIDPVGIFEELASVRQRMVEQELKPRSMYAAMVDVARSADDPDSTFDEPALRRHLTKQEKDESEIEALEKLLKAMKRTHDGTEQKQGFPSPELASAIESVQSRLSALLLREKQARLAADAAALGYDVQQVFAAIAA